MIKKLAITAAILSTLFLAIACVAPATQAVDDTGLAEAAAQIEALEAQIAEAQAASNVDEPAIAELQAQLEQAQQAVAEAEAQAEGALLAQCTYNLYGMGWVMDWADPGNMVDTVFAPDSSFQSTFWGVTAPEQAATFRSLVESAYSDPDQVHRATTWQQAERILIDELAVVLPLYHMSNTALVSPDLETSFPPFGSPIIADWYFTDGRTTLYTSFGRPVSTLDPNQSTDVVSGFMLAQMLTSPFQLDETGQIQPMAAERFEVSNDGRTFTIYLRQDAVWSDAQPVTAQHFVDGIKRLLSPDMANEYAFVMLGIEGATAYKSGEVDDLPSLKVVDDYTFEFTLSEPLSYFDGLLSFSVFFPVRLDIIEAHGSEWTLPENYPSNGAYVLVEHTPGERLIMEKNPLYWDADNVQIERIQVDIIAEPATALAAYETGALDMIRNVSIPREHLPRLAATPDLVRTPRPGTLYLAFSTLTGPTDNVHFRRALSHAVDKRVLLDDVLETPWLMDAYGVIPPEIYGYQGDAIGYRYDVDAAQTELQLYMDEAGISDPGEIVVELWYPRGAVNQTTLEAIEAMWEANLGIDIRMINVEFQTLLQMLNTCNASLNSNN